MTKTKRKPATTLYVHIRWMIRRDLAEVVAIERDAFDVAWDHDDFQKALRERDVIGMVAEHDGQIVGFMIYELQKGKLHVVNFAVHAAFRHRGVGRQLVNKLVGKLSPHRRTRVTLHVREHNDGAQWFWASCGFKAIKVLRRYYPDNDEDAYLFQFAVGDTDRTYDMGRVQ